MIVAVLDTNVLASGFAGYTKPDSTPGELLRRWRAGAFSPIASEHILTELARTLTNPYFTKRLSSSQIEAALTVIRIDASIQPLKIRVVGIATQPKGDLILAAALSAEAEFLVTGDKKLHGLASYGATRLVSPKQFLSHLERH